MSQLNVLECVFVKLLVLVLCEYAIVMCEYVHTSVLSSFLWV